MMMKPLCVAAGLAMLLTAACSRERDDGREVADGNVNLRHLSETEVAANARPRYPIEGQLIATPSDAKSRYYLIRERQSARGNVIAILRHETGEKIAYSRTEIDCGQRLFHVLGVGPDRRIAEANVAYDGPLRSIEGLPLRQEIAGHVCARNGTPLKAT